MHYEVVATVPDYPHRLARVLVLVGRMDLQHISQIVEHTRPHVPITIVAGVDAEVAAHIARLLHQAGIQSEIRPCNFSNPVVAWPRANERYVSDPLAWLCGPRRLRKGRCAACGYDLHGADHPHCPECGAPYLATGGTPVADRPPRQRLSRGPALLLLFGIGPGAVIGAALNESDSPLEPFVGAAIGALVALLASGLMKLGDHWWRKQSTRSS